jgi:hypothetical protein
MQKNKYLVKKLNYFILSNGTMYKNTFLLKQYSIKVKVNPLKKFLKVKKIINNQE